MKNSDINNIYNLDGKVPVSKAIPFGLQHILAMFVCEYRTDYYCFKCLRFRHNRNSKTYSDGYDCCGNSSVIQLYPIWKVGSGLPIVMGICFTFVSVFCFVGYTYGYGAIVGAVIIGGIIEGILGLFAKY